MCGLWPKLIESRRLNKASLSENGISTCVPIFNSPVNKLLQNIAVILFNMNPNMLLLCYMDPLAVEKLSSEHS